MLLMVVQIMKIRPKTRCMCVNSNKMIFNLAILLIYIYIYLLSEYSLFTKVHEYR